MGQLVEKFWFMKLIASENIFDKMSTLKERIQDNLF